MSSSRQAATLRSGQVGFIATVGFLTFLGCARDHIVAADKVAEETGRLYRSYLEGDCNQARRSLQQAIQILEKATIKPEGQAWGLFLGYARLYALDKRTGNDALAAADLVKARYWYLRRLELLGDSPDAVLDGLTKLTAEHCVDIVDKWDKHHTDGNGPIYLREHVQQQLPGASE